MSQKRILVVEDNPVNMELVVDLLEASGFLTVQADNAEDGIRMAQGERPDLILMDVALPGMDGLTATAILRQQPLTAHIPIVALTAHAMRGDEEKALAVGCIGYITKPINTRSFTRMVAEFADKKPETLVSPPTIAPPPAPAAPLPTTTLPPNWAESPISSPARVEKPPVERRPIPLLDEDMTTFLPPKERIQPPPQTTHRAGPSTPIPMEPVELLPIPGEARRGPERGFSDDGPVEPPLMPLPNPSARPTPGRSGDANQPFLMIPRKGRGGRQRESIAIVQESSAAKILVVDGRRTEPRNDYRATAASGLRANNRRGRFPGSGDRG